MRLWDYRLLKVLPDKFIIAQWRECIAIKRQWEKGTLKHRLVSYVMEEPKGLFYRYVWDLCCELKERNIKYQEKYLNEISIFTNGCGLPDSIKGYEQHNDRYLKQCLYNLQEKTDRGIITQEEWQKIEDKFGDVLND